MGKSPFRLCDLIKKSYANQTRKSLEYTEQWKEGQTVIGRLDVVDVLLEVEAVDGILIQQRCVAEVVGHHDGRVQRAEI